MWFPSGRLSPFCLGPFCVSGAGGTGGDEVKGDEGGGTATPGTDPFRHPAFGGMGGSGSGARGAGGNGNDTRPCELSCVPTLVGGAGGRGVIDVAICSHRPTNRQHKQQESNEVQRI